MRRERAEGRQAAHLHGLETQKTGYGTNNDVCLGNSLLDFSTLRQIGLVRLDGARHAGKRGGVGVHCSDGEVAGLGQVDGHGAADAAVAEDSNLLRSRAGGEVTGRLGSGAGGRAACARDRKHGEQEQRTR